MQENSTTSPLPALQAGNSSVQSANVGGKIPSSETSSVSGRLTPSDSAHVLRSMAEYAEGRAKSDALNEATSQRLRSVAERLRTHAADFSRLREN